MGTISNQMKVECKTAWDSLATEYYSEHHRTSRNFDTIVQHYLPKMLPRIRFDARYLDLGGGRGNLTRIIKELQCDKFPKIIVGDVSKLMMKDKNNLDPSCFAIQFDAFNMPFKSNKFDGVVSIMGDSYASKDVFREILRVLKKGGFLFITLPSKRWGVEIRKFLDIRYSETIFQTQKGVYRVPSFLYDSEELARVLSKVGFREVEVGEWKSGNLIPEEEFSLHVTIAAKCARIRPQSMPLVTFGIGLKEV